MSRSNSNGGHRFYVVRFIELPFPDVNTYVCVPYSWIISYSTSSLKAAVAYPIDEKSLAVRDWVKNRRKPNDIWPLYMATIEYQSDAFEDANNWIETRKDHEPCKKENSEEDIKDSETEPIVNRKLRSASQPFFFVNKCGKPSVSVRPKNRRKPLSRFSIRLPLQTQLTKNMDINSFKLNKIVNSVSNAINFPLTVSDDMKGQQPIIDSNNQSIQRTQTRSAGCLEDNTSCEQKLPDINERDKSVMPDQSAASKLPQNPPSLASQDSKPETSLTVIDTGFDEDDHEDNVADHLTPIKEAIHPGKTLANNPEPVPEPERINETSITLVHNENSLPQQRLKNVPVGQSKAALNSKTQVRQVVRRRRPSSAANQHSQNRDRQSVFLPPTSATHQTRSAGCLEDNTSCEQKLPDINKRDKSVMPDQSAATKLPQNPPSLASQDSKPEPSVTVIDTGFDEDDHEDNVADHLTPIKEAIYPGKFLANNPEPVPEPERINETSITLVHNENSLPQQRLKNVPVGQSKAALNSKTQVRQVVRRRRPSSAANQHSQNRDRQSVFLPPTSATHQNPRLQGANASSFTAATYTHKRPHSQGFTNNSSSPPHYIMMKPATGSRPPSIREKSPSVTENPVATRMCIENITRNSLTRQEPSTSTSRHHLFDHSNVKQAPQMIQQRPEEVSRQSTSYARSDFGVGAIDLRVPQRRMDTSATRNLSSLAQYSHSFAQSSYEYLQHYLLLKRQYFEQMARLNNRIEQPYIVHSTDRNSYLPNAMNSEFTLQNRPNPTVPTNQLLLQHYSQFGPPTHTDSAAAIQNYGSHIKHSAQNSHNQSHLNFNNPQQRQYLAQYQDLPNYSLQSKVNPQNTEHQGVIRTIQSPAPPKTASKPLLDDWRGYLLQDPLAQGKLNQNPTERQILNLVVPRNAVEETAPTAVNAEVQTETPSTLPPEIGIVYQNPRTNRLVIDQATEMDHVMDADHGEDEAAESDENSRYVVDRGCQTDAYPVEEQNTQYVETDSEPEISTYDEYLNEDECVNYSSVNAVGASRPTSPQNSNIEKQTLPVEELLSLYGTLLNQMIDSFQNTHDLFKHFQNNFRKCTEKYESLVEKIKERNQLQTSTSHPDDGTSRAYTKTVSERSNLDKIISVGSRPKRDHPHMSTFVLPPEYDPNNPKWTCKYQRDEPGLIELIPHTKVYVNKKALRKCQRKAKDCRTLMQLLLTEVYSRNALSVCSLTDKAKAFNSLNDRPELDKVARRVLFIYVERYGAKHGWKTNDTLGIIRSMDTKILEIREKYG